MRALDIISAVLLIIGGLNWGLIGFFEYNLIGAIFGEMSGLTRIIYSLVGISALYQIFFCKSIQQRARKK
ncbi:MAG: hypothetical protein KR126chlam1_00775 [Chlamydiae bacterium]|nr:hypothetical protein [Chlamydiota bacterium]